MKKNESFTGINLKRFYSTKFGKIMRLSLLFFLFGALNLVASNSYSQKTKITLNLNQSAVSQVLKKIESQSEFYFLYNNKLIDIERKVDVSVKKKQIKDILDDLFAGTDVSYLVIDRQIVLTPKSMIAKAIKGNNLLLTPQQITITGNVTDENGNPLPGANVIVKGTEVGTTTDPDGNFSLDLPVNATTIMISFIGYTTREILLDGKNNFNVQLMPEVSTLDEIVVTGYTTEKKSDLTGAVAVVKVDELTSQPVSGVDKMLQGRVPGLNVISSGSPGGQTAIRIRGFSTIRNNDPLYIIDGVPTTGGIDLLNPNDIESIQVLKDASSPLFTGRELPMA